MRGLFDKQIEEVFEIKENGTKEEMLSLLKPYLDDPEKNITYDDIPDEFVEELDPERYKETFLEYELSFIIDWNDKFSMIDSWEYLNSSTMEKLGITPEEAKRSAIQNMEHGPRLDFSKIKSDDYGTDVYIIKTNRKFDLHPSFVCSVLTLKDYWKDVVCKEVGESFLVLPIFREAVFVIPDTMLEHISKISQKIRADYEKKRYEAFSDRIYKYVKGSMI